MTDPELLDEDFRAALKEMVGFVDISEEDLVQVYRLALAHAKRRLEGSMLVGQVMTREVISVPLDAHVHEAESLLFRHRISGLPVVDGEGRVVGVVSEQDFLYRLEDPGLFTFMDRLKHYLHKKKYDRKVRGNKVEDLMTSPAVTVREDLPIHLAAMLLVEKKINRLPVVDAEGRLAGIVSRADLIRVLHQGGGS